MKEQVISFDTAKLAKEKGFDIQNYETKYYLEYLEDEIFDDPRKGHEITLKHKGDIICGRSPALVTVKYKSWLAPTQSLLQKWLREIHKIDIYIAGYGLGYYPSLNNVPPSNQGNILYIDRRWNLTNKEMISDLKTYEEALEKGLQEALKLI